MDPGYAMYRSSFSMPYDSVPTQSSEDPINPPSVPRKRQAASAASASFEKSSAAKKARIEDLGQKLQTSMRRVLSLCEDVIAWYRDATIMDVDDAADTKDVVWDWRGFLNTYPNLDMEQYERIKQRMIITKSLDLRQGTPVLKFGRQTF
jgi:hypothetical protein